MSSEFLSWQKKSYYGMLGITQMATEEEIRKAFRIRAKECHPDRFPLSSQERDQAESYFKELMTAKDTLLDPALREAYDESQALLQQAYLDAVVYEVPIQTKPQEDAPPTFVETLKEVFKEKKAKYEHADYMVDDDGARVYNRRSHDEDDDDVKQTQGGVPEGSKKNAASFYYSQGLRYAARGQFRRALYALNNAKMLNPDLKIPEHVMGKIRAQAYYYRR